MLPQLLVKHPVQLPGASVRRAVHAAEVRRRQLLIAAHVTDRMLLPLVVHVRRQPEAADASEAQRHVRRRGAALVCSRPGGGGGFGSLALGLQRRQHGD
eukprot:scaffold99951_cov63-Phaeocystis_antarctica.AAC.5